MCRALLTTDLPPTFRKAVNPSSPSVLTQEAGKLRVPPSLPFPTSAGHANVSASDRVPFVLEQKEHEDLFVLSETVPIFTLWYTIL